jgi:alpha-L-rhamnosidase
MLHDYWMYRPDPEFVRTLVPGTRTILDWFAHYEAARRPAPQTPLVELHRLGLQGETPTYDANGESCITTLEYLGALDDAASLEKPP